MGSAAGVGIAVGIGEGGAVDACTGTVAEAGGAVAVGSGPTVGYLEVLM